MANTFITIKTYTICYFFFYYYYDNNSKNRFFFIKYSIEKYVSKYKECMVRELLEKVFDNLIYRPNFGLNRTQLLESGLFNTCSTIYSNDYISGMYKDIAFVQSDIQIQDLLKLNYKRSTEFIFNGRWFIFNFNKQFKYDLIIRENGTLDYGSKTLQVEDLEFSQKFSISSNNPEGAFYILTPSFIENIKEIEKMTPGKIIFSFKGSKLHIALRDYKNSFEPRLLNNFDEEQAYDYIIKDIKIITNFINELKLNDNLFE